jgi:tRNA A-37 threonylcarbamoyl transferase component Bud32
MFNYTVMADNRNAIHPCPRCGATVASDAPDGLCPQCLIALSLATQTEIPGDPTTPAGAPAPLTPTAEELARFFPELEVRECLGRGGMGAVYKARQPKLDRFVALKILLRRCQDGQAETSFAERFAREARALARLNHPNIVAVYDSGEAGGYPFLVMEYVDGLTLRQLLQRGKLAPEEALAIVPKICEALQFAHQKGIVHRDIKPENILLDTAGQVKITDFGIAKVIAPGAPDHSLTGAKDVVGTPHYMAPEQIEEPGKVDHRADIFSLGVVFYEMLTGELPLGKFQPPSSKVQIDVRLDEVVLRALAKEPERRYQQVCQVKTAVETITNSDGKGSAATPAAPSSPPAAAVMPQFGNLVASLFGLTFTSPRALKVANLSALGFIGCLGFIPIPSPRWQGVFGFFGFFGLIGIAFMIEVVARRKRNIPFDDTSGAAVDARRSSAHNPQASAGPGGPGVLPEVEPPSAPPRWSRMAVWCSMWAILFAVNWLWSYTPPGWNITNALRDALGNWAVGLVMGPLAIMAFAAPVGVTALGWMAVSEIRRSQGRLHGLALAMADGVLFPLLLVDGWLVWLCQRVGAAISGRSHPGPTGAVTLGVALALVLDAILIAWLWHRIRKPLPPLPASPVSAGEAADPERSWRKLIWKTAPRAALIGAVQLCLLETILQASVHRPESTGELWYMALLSSSLAAMVWAAWPLRRARSPVPAVGGGALALFVALCGLDAFYSTQVRPNLGLHEEVDWLSQVPGLRWGQRQQTARALWNKPLARPFAPTVETILPLDERHPVALLDLDTGGQQSRDGFAPDDEQARAWVRAEKLDLAIISGKNKITVLGLDLREGYVPVPRLVRVEELTSQAAVNYWALDRKPAKALADLYVDKSMTGTYAFHTREGGVGFLEFAGLSQNPRGVKIRCKLVPDAVKSPANAAAAQILSFGPVIERVVNDEPATNSLLDLDSGHFVTVRPPTKPSGLEEARKQEAAAFARAGADVAGLSPKVSEVSGLIGLDLVASPVLASSWETASGQWVKDAVLKFKSGSITPISGKGKLPATYVFKTREGGTGLLQILGFIDTPQPSGVRIRYKLVQDTKAPTSKITNPVPGIASATHAVVRQQVATRLAAMRSRLRLTDDQERAVRGLLEKKFGWAGQLSASLSGGALSGEEMQKAEAALQQIDAQFKEVLNPTQWADYERYQAEERRTQAQLAANVEVMELQPVLQLSQPQRDQVLQKLIALHEQQLAKTYDGLKIPLDWEEQLADMREALRPLLNAAQVQSLGKWIELQREIIKQTISEPPKPNR